ncbi:hypothetical protein RJ55_01127 [Drechmeria coniospora]|nr:hypothetical protein RJ55_01127 [Drechmeria coniospora]
MASSPSPSPASRGPSPERLTPRSKIKALLATVGSSDDEDGPVSLARKEGSSSRRCTPKAHAQDDSEESDVTLRPRGKLASRMRRNSAAKVSNSMAPAAEKAARRVEEFREREQAEAEPEASGGEAADIDDDDDELPVAPRRLKRRATRQSTPSVTERSATRSPSPGLFVSSPVRPCPETSIEQGSDSDAELPALKSDRFRALVERKKQERLAREAADEALKAEKRARQENLASELEQLESDDSGITDDEAGRKLTQGDRPSRKASKKAMEDINRETQRMARNMQLTHEARTRKKITKASLFAKFNFRPASIAPEPKTHSSSRPSSPVSDVDMKDVETPPSSPPAAKATRHSPAEHATDAKEHNSDEGLPCPDDVVNSSQPSDKVKGKSKDTAPSIDLDKPATKPQRRVRVQLCMVNANNKVTTVSSDEDLLVTRTTKERTNAVFDRIPANVDRESRSLKALRALAQVKSPGKSSRRGDDHATMTSGELQAQLYLKARQQAKLERENRLDLLKAQGIIVPTADERERQEQEVEDLVAKARKEAEQIMQQERADAKKDGQAKGEVDPLAWDDSEEDEEYQDSTNEADVEESAIELSGSDESEDEAEDEEEATVDDVKVLFDEDADSVCSEAEPQTNHDSKEDSGGDDDGELPALKQRRPRNHTAILSDDEAEVEATPRPPRTVSHTTPGAPKTVSPAVPTSVLRSARKTFIPGLPVQGAAGLGLTQIFAGTMDDSQPGSFLAPTQSMMPDFDHFPDSNFSATANEGGEDVIMNSQWDMTQGATQAQESRSVPSPSQRCGVDGMTPGDANTQTTEMMDLSQDGGLATHTPIRDRFVEPPISTVETVAADQNGDATHESPLVRRGRLRQKMAMLEVEETTSAVADKAADNAFGVMAEHARKGKGKRLVDNFDRKKTKAKEMVEEQADESEDEYAGLGGADGEDSDNESEGSVQEIIDDEAGNDVDEGKLAAFYADRARASDEKEVEKLFKDITTGMLRRKRGADYDLSDSDDGGEARRRMKRRQFAKMQKALFSDERVKKMAENPGNQAFLRTIEDHGSDDDMDMLHVVDGNVDQPQSQDDTSSQPSRVTTTIPDSQPTEHRALAASGANSRPAAHMRRTKDGRKPSNIGEVRETLSNLLEEREGSIVPATQAGSDSESEGEALRSDKENTTARAKSSEAVVDRIRLKRNGSSASSASGSRLAFAASASSSSFKVPALLRRATTNSTLMSGSGNSSGSNSPSTAGTTTAGGFGDEAKIKKGAGKKSGIGGFQRETEQRAMMKESERRREQKKVKGAVKRVGMVGGLLGRGSFE